MRAVLTCGARFIALGLVLCAVLFPVRLAAQDNQHVVAQEELNKAAAGPANVRQANEAGLRQLFSSEQAQKALKSANIDYTKVDKAVGQLSDEDLAKLAERSRQAQRNFSAGKAGNLTDRDLLIIIIIAVLLIALIAVLR